MNDFPDAPDSARRMILKGAVAGGLVGLGFGAFPFPAFADADAKEWPADAFKQKSEADALKALYGKTAPRRRTRSISTRRRSPRTARWCRSR